MNENKYNHILHFISKQQIFVPFLIIYSQQLTSLHSMPKTHTTITSLSQGYPFPLTLPNFQHLIQIKLPLTNRSAKDYHIRMKKIIDLELLCNHLIKLNHVTHDTTRNELLLEYEFVPFSLREMFEMKIELAKIYPKIYAICQFLLQKKILPVYDPKRFGFTQNKQLKYFLDPDYQQITNEHDLNQQFDQLEFRIKTLCKSIKPTTPISPRQTFEDDKNSQRISERDLSAYNKKFEQKISQIESKLLLSRQGNSEKMSTSQKLKRRKKLSHNFTEENVSISSSSSNSVKFQNKKSKEFETQQRNSFKNEYEQRNSKTSPQRYYIKSSAPLGKKSSSQEQVESPENVPGEKASKLTNSLIIEEKNEEMQKLKHHKSSFGDYSNYGNESEKQMKLKRRISFALEKSQNALKVYEKYQSMRSSQPHQPRK